VPRSGSAARLGRSLRFCQVLSGAQGLVQLSLKPRSAETIPSAHGADRAIEIERLAALEPIDYEAARIEAAKRLRDAHRLTCSFRHARR
jgi:hypothetical protein